MHDVSRSGALAVAMLVLACSAPAAAQASTAFAHVYRDEDDYAGPVTFTAAPGERNRLTITRGRLGIVFHDAGSRVRATGQCRSLDPHTATCPTSAEEPSASLGDRADVVVDAYGASLHGGPGDDRLSGGAATYGDAGDDVLRGTQVTGGPGRDRFIGTAGSDTFFDGETDAQAAPDTIDGGPPGPYGNTVDFSLRHRPMWIDLAKDRTSTGDTMRNIQNVVTGSGDDQILGSSADNTIDSRAGDDVVRAGAGQDGVLGGPGADRIWGESGYDVLWGNAGEDQLRGGGGDDLLESNEPSEGGTAAPTAADLVSCGSGFDKVVGDASDTLGAACEEVWAAHLRISATPVVHDMRADFRAVCAFGVGTGCSGTLALSSASGEPYGGAAVDVAENATATVSVPLTPQATAALAAGTMLVVTVTPATPDPFTFPGGWRMHVRTSVPASSSPIDMPAGRPARR